MSINKTTTQCHTTHTAALEYSTVQRLSAVTILSHCAYSVWDNTLKNDSHSQQSPLQNTHTASCALRWHECPHAGVQSHRMAPEAPRTQLCAATDGTPCHQGNGCSSAVLWLMLLFTLPYLTRLCFTLLCFTLLFRLLSTLLSTISFIYPILQFCVFKCLRLLPMLSIQ